MKVTKHEHACLVIEDGRERLVIDPGSFTTPLLGVDHVVAIVITHEHPDHWTPEQLARLVDQNPDAVIYGPQGVADAVDGRTATVVAPGDTVTAGPFTVSFFGGRHAVIHSSIPVVDNLGVVVNGTLVYPGDSYAVPEGLAVDTLAVPSSAPWLKIGEVMDYVQAVAPRRAFPTHEAGASKIGQQMANARIEAVVGQGGGRFFPLAPGESLDL